MNLIPAEQVVERLHHAFIRCSGGIPPIEPIELIRQIQANALRWVAEKANALPHYRDSLAFSIAVNQFTESLSLQADQLALSS